MYILIRNGRRYIFLWVVPAERFQIIWVIGVRPNQITWVVGISLRGRGRKNIICQKREKFYQIKPKESNHENGHFCLHVIVKPRMFPSYIGKKNGIKINSPIVASVAVITSLGKHVFSEEFIQGNNPIG